MTRPDLKDDDLFTEKLLKLPRKIDIYNYAPCTGGEFFQSMLVLSCPKTRAVLKHKDYQESLLRAENNIKLFRRIEYMGMGRGYEVMRLLHLFSPDELISFFKYLIVNAIVDSRKLKEWNDTLIILSGHYDFRSKKARIWAEYEHWDVIKLNPETQSTRDLVKRMCVTIFGPVESATQEYLIDRMFTKYSYQENFPFLEYILYEDYDLIKYFIENRYGSEMDFDFIDQSLRMWKEVRVDPYL